MKLISWNVNGIRACVNKGFTEFFDKIDADIFCIQETKCQPGQIELNFEGYKAYWNSEVDDLYEQDDANYNAKLFTLKIKFKNKTTKNSFINKTFIFKLLRS